MAQQILEGTWEEIAAHPEELTGKWMTVLIDDAPSQLPVQPDVKMLALAEELTALQPNTRLLTFDRDLPKQAARNAPGVIIHLL